MKLTSFQGKKRSPNSKTLEARTTLPGFVNPRAQEVLHSTGARSTTRDGQVIYRMKCRGCSLEYGANGCDVHARTCPGCQQGTPGEPLPERPATLFS